MKDALDDLPKTKSRIRNPPLPTIEHVEDSRDLQGKGFKLSNLLT